MALTELQISNMLGYGAEPEQNAVTVASKEMVHELVMVMVEAKKQRTQGLLPVVEYSWTDFLPWHSAN